MLVDLGSSNGSRLNHRKLLPSQLAPLHPGDLLELASEKFLYHEIKSDLWDDVLRHIFLAGFIRMQVPILRDRKVKTLGKG